MYIAGRVVTIRSAVYFKSLTNKDIHTMCIFFTKKTHNYFGNTAKDSTFAP